MNEGLRQISFWISPHLHPLSRARQIAPPGWTVVDPSSLATLGFVSRGGRERWGFAARLAGSSTLLRD